jgi:hypothetical protein
MVFPPRGSKNKKQAAKERHRRKLAAYRKSIQESTQTEAKPCLFAQKNRTLMSTADLPEMVLRLGRSSPVLHWLSEPRKSTEEINLPKTVSNLALFATYQINQFRTQTNIKICPL